MSRMDRQDDLVPIAQAALLRRETREITLRRVMRGEIVGELRGNRWYAAAPEPDEAHTLEPTG